MTEPPAASPSDLFKKQTDFNQNATVMSNLKGVKYRSKEYASEMESKVQKAASDVKT